MRKNQSLIAKFQMINIFALQVLVILVLVSVVTASDGMHQFSDALELNEQSREFWNAIIDERKAFQAYLNDEDPEAYDHLEMAKSITEKALASLPYDYETMTIDQYIQTNSIYNAYRRYDELQKKVLSMDSNDTEYQNTILKYYEVGEYLERYAGKLETMAVDQGIKRYDSLKNLFYIIPAICLMAGIMVMITFLWIYFYVQKKVIQPVTALSDEAKRISEHDFSGTKVEIPGPDEIAVLVNSFSKMKEATQNYISTMEEKHQVEKQLVETRYQMLKNQINPHFLFNTLNLIASTAEIEDAQTTEKMIVTLSRLFRYNLKSETAVMPLEQELKVVEDYMYLQQMRFGARIKYMSDIAPETLQVLVPSFVLQPIVENAIIHGLSKSAEGGIILVRSWIRDDVTWISVADTGEGMDMENNQDRNRESEGTGIGLKNIEERIRGIYENSGIRIYSKKNHGTVVQLYLGTH